MTPEAAITIYELRVALNRIIDLARGNEPQQLEMIVDVAQSALERAGEPDDEC